MEFKLPDLGENIASGDVVSLLVKEGDVVKSQQDVIETATKGHTVSQIFERERRFDLVVRLLRDENDVASLRNLTVSAPSGERIPVSQLAEFVKSEGLTEVIREGNVRRVVVKWSARERDMGGLVAEAMKKVEATVKLPEGYRMVWSGRFEDQQRALVRGLVVVAVE